MEDRISIELTSTGMVIAETYSLDGRRTGLKFFNPLFRTDRLIKRNLIKARKWAESHLQMADEYEA
jgi:hypothetical protein